jgi:hypothetical protein
VEQDAVYTKPPRGSVFVSLHLETVLKLLGKSDVFKQLMAKKSIMMAKKVFL